MFVLPLNDINYLLMMPSPSAIVGANDFEAQQIRHFIEVDYVESANSNDASRYAALYTDTALWSPPGAPDRRGPAAIRFAFLVKMADIKIEMNLLEYEIVTPGFGFATGIVLVNVRPRNGQPDQNVIYRALWHLGKYENTWKIVRQIFTEKPSVELM